MEKRIFLYPADLMILTGKSYRSCFRLYHTLLDCLGKSKNKKLTIGEYCELESVKEEEVKKQLNIN